MDRRIETFLQAAECGSFSEAARRLFVTQPAVTQQIASLGDELGVRLFEREGNRMVLTTPGRIAQRHYLLMRAEEQALSQELAPWSARRTFTVGCPSGMIAYDEERYSQVLHIAMECFPDTEVRSVQLADPSQHFRMLADHEADVVVSGVEPMLAEHAKTVVTHVLRAIRHFVVCRRDDPLAQLELVRMDDLAGRVVFTFASEAFPTELVRALTEVEGAAPALRRQESLAGTLPLVQAGRGVTIYAQKIPLPADLTLVPLDFARNAHVGLVWFKETNLPSAGLKRFAREVVAAYKPERDEEKLVWRAQMRKARAAMTPKERAGQSAQVCARLLALPQVQEAKSLACYLSFADELDLREFMRAALARGQRVALPVTLRDRRLVFVDMEARELADPALLPGCLREPTRALADVPAELEARVVDAADIDAAVLPGLAFDGDGMRLGYGGGYYDAWLGSAFAGGSRPWLVGACFTCQLLPPEARLPREPYDVAMDAVVSPQATWERGARREDA